MPRIKYVQTINRIVMKRGEYASSTQAVRFSHLQKDIPGYEISGDWFLPAKSAAFQNRKRKEIPQTKSIEKCYRYHIYWKKEKEKKYRYLLKSTDSYVKV